MSWHRITSISPVAGWVLGAGGRRAHLLVIFSTNSLRTDSAVLNISGAVGVAHHLHQTFAVAQVDEDDAAVVAAAMHPAADGDDLVEVGGGDFAAVASCRAR